MGGWVGGWGEEEVGGWVGGWVGGLRRRMGWVGGWVGGWFEEENGVGRVHADSFSMKSQVCWP